MGGAAPGGAMSSASPGGLARVLAAPRSQNTQATWALMAACIMHACLIALPRPAAAPAAPAAHAATQIVDLEPPPRVVPPPPPPEVPPPEPSTQPRAVAAAATPPPPAQAAAVLTQKEAPNAPADLTDSMVVGTAETYVGGSTSAGGTTRRTLAVAGTAARGGGGVVPAAAKETSGPDRSKGARLAEGGSWNCPFPSEADTAQIDHAVVTLRIAVAPDGSPLTVTVTADPGNGFGREASACAMRKRFSPALDHGGRPIAGSSLVNVRFDR
jgi:outer membrane biosynthesis protein TonB